MNLATVFGNSGGSAASCSRLWASPWPVVTFLPVEGPEQLDLVVPGQAQRGAVGHHAHDEAEHSRRGRAPVDQVPEEERPTTVGVAGRGRRRIVDLVAELGAGARRARCDNRGCRR